MVYAVLIMNINEFDNNIKYKKIIDYLKSSSKSLSYYDDLSDYQLVVNFIVDNFPVVEIVEKCERIGGNVKTWHYKYDITNESIESTYHDSFSGHDLETTFLNRERMAQVIFEKLELYLQDNSKSAFTHITKSIFKSDMYIDKNTANKLDELKIHRDNNQKHKLI